MSRTVNVSSWPPATTTAPGPTLTLNGLCVKNSLEKARVHDQLYTQTISSYRARVHDRRVERERLRTLRVWSGNNLSAETGFWFSYHFHLCMSSASKVLLIVVVFGDHIISRHLFGANTPPRSKSLSLITTLLWNCLCCRQTNFKSLLDQCWVVDGFCLYWLICSYDDHHLILGCF